MVSSKVASVVAFSDLSEDHQEAIITNAMEVLGEEETKAMFPEYFHDPKDSPPELLIYSFVTEPNDISPNNARQKVESIWTMLNDQKSEWLPNPKTGEELTEEFLTVGQLRANRNEDFTTATSAFFIDCVNSGYKTMDDLAALVRQDGDELRVFFLKFLPSAFQGMVHDPLKPEIEAAIMETAKPAVLPGKKAPKGPGGRR